jgi:ribosomal protein S18 acetylase RimI-like enzyme
VEINNLYQITKKDINISAEILARAFYDYSIFKYILGEGHNEESIKIFLRFLIKYSVLYREAYASSSKMEGIILFTEFKKDYFSLIKSLRAGALSLYKLGAEAGNKFNEFDKFTIETHKKIITEPHQYIILLGVDPTKQGQGYGKKLMQLVLKVAEEKAQPCYLETHGEKNVAFYNKIGFKVVSEDLVPGTDIIQYSMLKGK